MEPVRHQDFGPTVRNSFPMLGKIATALDGMSHLLSSLDMLVWRICADLRRMFYRTPQACLPGNSHSVTPFSFRIRLRRLPVYKRRFYSHLRLPPRPSVCTLFGAFLAGVCMPRNSLWQTSPRAHFDTTVSVVVLPLFFALSGMRTRIDLLNTSAVWIWTGIVLFAAFAGKLGGAILAARLSH